MVTSTTQRSIHLFVLVFLLTMGVAEAKVKTVTGQLRLMATIEGKPAFRPVIWQLTRSKRSKPLSIGKKLTRHTVTLDLEPGTYYVSVSLDHKTLTRKVVVKESRKHFLKIDLG